MLPAEATFVPGAPGWRRTLWRTAAICGAAEAALLPPILLVAWPMALTDLAFTVLTQVGDFLCVGLILAATLDAVELRPGWPRSWRYALLGLGLGCAVAFQQIWPVGSTLNVFDQAGMHERLESAGVADDPPAIRLHLTWFTVILAAVSILYLLQERESIEVEQRRLELEDQWRMARRRVRQLRDAAGAARLDPQVLFDCMALSQREYLSEASDPDALLDRLIDFLRGSLSATRAGPHTLGSEIDQAARFVAVLGHGRGVRLIDQVEAGLRELPLSPGLLLSLVQQWLSAERVGSCSVDGSPLRIDAAIEGARSRRLEIQLNGPAVAAEALLAESRLRVAELYGDQAVISVQARDASAAGLEIRLQLPLEPVDVD